MSALELTDVHKAFGATRVLCGVDLAVPAGSLTAVLGPSGCGKTTLLRVTAGFEPPDGGEVRVDGRPVTALAPEHRQVGVVPQEGALFPHLDVAGNVAFAVRDRRTRARRVSELLEMVGLPGSGKRRPAELSGGQQQRVALARALAAEPRVLLLDEPFSALDAGLRADVRAEVRGVLRRAGATAVLVTHDQEEALSMADHVAVLWGGRVRQHDTPQQVYSRPCDLDVARFVGEAVELPGHGRGDEVTCALGTLPVAGRHAQGTGTVLLRPAQLRLDDASCIRARVVGRTFFGQDIALTLELGDGRRLTARTASDTPVTAEVGLTVHGPACFYPSS